MERLTINQVELPGTVVRGENEGEFILNFRVQGANNFHLFSNLLNNETFDIQVPSWGQDFKAKRVSSSSTYSGQLEQNTVVDFSVIYKEDKEEEPEWNSLVGTLNTAANNWVRTRALSELLIERGIFTKKEYEEKLNLVTKRDFEEMNAYIFEGKVKEQEENEE